MQSNGPKEAGGMANSVDPEQTAQQFDLGLHCLHRPICRKTLDHWDIFDHFSVHYNVRFSSLICSIYLCERFLWLLSLELFILAAINIDNLQMGDNCKKMTKRASCLICQ